MEINWLSQLAAAASALVIGALWYGPLFGKYWQSQSAVTFEKMKQGHHPILLYGCAFVLAFITSMGLKTWVVDIHSAFNSVTEYPFWHGAQHGAKIAFLFGAIPVLITNALFDQKSWGYILVNTGYWILTFAVMSGLIEILD